MVIYVNVSLLLHINLLSIYEVILKNYLNYHGCEICKITHNIASRASTSEVFNALGNIASSLFLFTLLH